MLPTIVRHYAYLLAVVTENDVQEVFDLTTSEPVLIDKPLGANYFLILICFLNISVSQNLAESEEISTPYVAGYGQS